MTNLPRQFFARHPRADPEPAANLPLTGAEQARQRADSLYT